MSTTLRRRTHPRPSFRLPYLGRLLTLPFVAAHRAFRPARPDRVTDAGIEAAQIARTAIGIVATLWLVYAYPLQESAAAFALGKATEALVSTLVMLVAGPLVLAGFILAARGPARAVYRRRLTGPVTGFGALLGSVAALWFLIVEGGGLQSASAHGSLPLLGPLLSMAGMLFALPFGITAALLCVHYTFRAADVHEVLPPLIAPVLTWVTFGFQVLDTSPVAAPAAVQLLFLVGPPLSVTALSAWELRRLRTAYGMTVRRALLR
ncbi:hypothetical protein [Streptomyces sp. NPDC058268]|uniref:hypothetical protein n=1 Tax=Streptomyces sp. NPDC058268 TaxID=3346413 RepID=UPI0036E213F9